MYDMRRQIASNWITSYAIVSPNLCDPHHLYTLGSYAYDWAHILPLGQQPTKHTCTHLTLSFVLITPFKCETRDFHRESTAKFAIFIAIIPRNSRFLSRNYHEISDSCREITVKFINFVCRGTTKFCNIYRDKFCPDWIKWFHF